MQDSPQISEKIAYRRTIPLWRLSSEVVNFLRPLRRREDKTARPAADDMRLRKPCLFLRFVFEGW